MINEIEFKKVKEDARMPESREGDAGYDLYPCFTQDYIIIQPNETTLIPTGLASSVPEEHVAVIFERGSVGSKGLARRAGIVDPSYRGEWFVGITNTGTKSVAIAKNSRKVSNITGVGEVLDYENAIAQFIIFETSKPEITEVDELDETERGEDALGSTDMEKIKEVKEGNSTEEEYPEDTTYEDEPEQRPEYIVEDNPTTNSVTNE